MSLYGSCLVALPGSARLCPALLGSARLCAALRGSAHSVAMSFSTPCPLHSYVARNILEPLGMKHSGAYYTDQVRAFMVEGVSPSTGKRSPLPCPTCSPWGAPAGQLYSTLGRERA